MNTYPKYFNLPGATAIVCLVKCWNIVPHLRIALDTGIHFVKICMDNRCLKKWINMVVGVNASMHAFKWFLISILCKNLRNRQEVGHDMSRNLLIFIYMAQLTPNIVDPSTVYHWWYRLPWKRVHPNFRLWEPVNLADFCLIWGKISAFLITTTTLVSLLLYSTPCCVKFLIILNATDQ